MTTRIKTLADFQITGVDLVCFHCEATFPTTAPVERNENCIVVACCACGCLTTFAIVRERRAS